MKYRKIKMTFNIKSKRLIFCFEFAWRTMGHQNTTFDFQFCFEFAMRTMGHHVVQCFHNKYKDKRFSNLDNLV